jgi:hypothetical protein
MATIQDQEIEEEESLESQPEFYAEFKKPPKSLRESQEMVENAIERFKRRKVTLDVEELSDLENEMSQIVEDWEDSRSGLEQMLLDLNDAYEGAGEETDYPWPGASSLVIPYGKIKGREITSVITRTTMRPSPFAVASYAGPDSLYQESASFVKDIEDFVEDKIKNDTNIHETLSMSPPVIFRDGTTPIQIMWETEYERVSDYKLYADQLEFVTDYPTFDDAGIPEKKWQSIVDKLSQGEKYEIRYEYDVATYDAPKAYMVSLIDFVHWPIHVSEMKDLLCYGKRVCYTDYKLRMKANIGIFDKDQIDDLIKGGGDEHEDSLASSRDRIEGLNRNTSLQHSKEFEVFELVYKGPVTKEDKEKNIFRKYLIYYYKKNHKILRVEHYPIRKGAINYFPLRFIKRDNRLLGVSLLYDILDLLQDINIKERQIINSRTITHVPSFKAKMSAKTSFDPSRREFRFRPGVTFYMTDVNDVMQFDIRPVDLSGSMDDILFIMQMVDMTVGSTSGFSGQSNPIDPRAPARKQQELLRQSGNRIDDYVRNLIPDFSAICQFVLDLYYQYAPERIKYFAKSKDGVLIEKEIERTKLYNPHARFRINGTSVFMNADQEYDRALENDSLIRQNPLTMQNPKVLKKSLERVLMASRIQDWESFIPSEEETPDGVTNELERDLEAKQALTREKTQARMLGDQAKRQHEKEMALIEAVANPAVPTSPNPTEESSIAP